MKYWLKSYSHYRYACSIPDLETDTVVLTGGVYTQTSVSRYGKEGWIEDFSSGLRYGRYDHGCASFLSNDNELVKFLLDLNSNNHCLIIQGVACHWRQGREGWAPCLYWGVSPLYRRVEGGPCWCSAQANAWSSYGYSQQQSSSLWWVDHYNLNNHHLCIYKVEKTKTGTIMRTSWSSQTRRRSGPE